jgi:hypothetical protein
MNSTKPRSASAVDRARMARLNRSELEHSLELARRALQAFGASAGRQSGPEEESALEHDSATA